MKHPKSFTCDDVVDTLAARLISPFLQDHMNFAGSYPSPSMKTGISNKHLVLRLQVLEAGIDLDSRGGYFSQSTLTSAAVKAFSEDQAVLSQAISVPFSIPSFGIMFVCLLLLVRCVCVSFCFHVILFIGIMFIFVCVGSSCSFCCFSFQCCCICCYLICCAKKTKYRNRSKQKHETPKNKTKQQQANN